ncbi:dynein-associated protein, putative [Plasmodium vivax]|uniref:Dynein-associated protein, putative n=2 Tax=Plasmodium vivax TaxID=5855 RepID=A5K128_PLAVS|nr:dynein-associated protein, putative [Plasmodium vivax]EDL47025.1 dynein-associated protein, putative [Plasmodium vivax]KMZ83817.1 dynein-associated protein [Plasmodium vivax Brazil I]|eukprot:XP_001616752.1 dynein-associated protein [Plasmodium vivax Sal-1]
MKDYLEGHNKYLKYDNCILVEHEEEESKIAKEENCVKDKNIVRVIQEIRKNIRSNVLYKNDGKNALFNEPLYNMFPLKCVRDKKVDQISYVCRVTSEEDATACLKKIQDIVSKMYAQNMLIEKDFLEDLLSVFMELCRQVSVTCFQRGSLLRQLFNYNSMLLFHYHKLVRSSLTFNLKKEIKRSHTMSELRQEMERKKEAINSLRSEILDTDRLIEEERANAEREMSEVNIIYQNKIDKLKKNNQRKRDEFTRLLQL